MSTTWEAAADLGVSQRVVQQLVADGTLNAVGTVGTVGTTRVLDPMSVRAARRSRGRGRRWEARILRAALAILDGRDSAVAVSSSEKSRLRAHLRDMDAQQFAYRAAGRSKRRRMSLMSGGREALVDALALTSASALRDADVADEFDLTAGPSWMLSGYTEDINELSSSFHLVDDLDGDVGIFESAYELPTRSTALLALDLYVWGDTRESTAGRLWIEHRLVTL